MGQGGHAFLVLASLSLVSICLVSLRPKLLRRLGRLRTAPRLSSAQAELQGVRIRARTSQIVLYIVALLCSKHACILLLI
jgi:hypothetical protein